MGMGMFHHYQAALPGRVWLALEEDVCALLCLSRELLTGSAKALGNRRIPFLQQSALISNFRRSFPHIPCAQASMTPPVAIKMPSCNAAMPLPGPALSKSCKERGKIPMRTQQSQLSPSENIRIGNLPGSAGGWHLLKPLVPCRLGHF